MDGPADLLMPKLGLTMEEGRIVRWEVQPGARFARGDVVVVVETDKIASEVEAPAAGVLLEVLAEAGSVLAVSVPIARWRLDEAPRERALPPAPQGNGAAARAAATERRLIATPYARRLAREAGLTLAAVAGTGPGGRIKAADVLRSRPERKPASGPERAEAPGAAARAGPAREPTPPSRRQSLAEITVDTAGATRLTASLQGGRPATSHTAVIVMAVLRAAPELADGGAATVALEVEAAPGTAWLPMAGGEHARLSALTAAIANATGETHRAGPAAAGTVLVVPGRASIRRLAPAPPLGWSAALGIGCEHAVTEPDAQGGLRLRREQTLVLCYDASLISNARAQAFLATVQRLLEEPLLMLAG